MARLAGKQVAALSGFLKDLYSVHDPQAFRREIVFGINKLVSSNLASYNEFDHQRQFSNWVSRHPEALDFPDSVRIFLAHVHEHPVVAHHAQGGDCGALKISDFLSKRQYRNLGLYQDFYRRAGVDHQISLVLPANNSAETWIVLSRTGGSDFGDQDRLLLNLVRPHIVQAYSNARVMSQMPRKFGLSLDAPKSLDLGVSRVKRNGRVLPSERAEHLLMKYFPRSMMMWPQLPDKLWRWIRKCKENFQHSAIPSVLMPFVVEHSTGRLVVRFVPNGDDWLLILTEHPKDAAAKSLLSFGLTPREVDVLDWVTQGKTNTVIGSILGLSPRTVQKHLEHIFQKLGVETRTSAAALALRMTNETLWRPDKSGRSIH